MFIDKTTIEAIQQLSAISNASDDAVSNFKANVNKAYDLFWFGIVPPQVLVQFSGTSSKLMMDTLDMAQQFIKAVEPSYEVKGVPEGYEVSFNEDGSGEITIVE